MAGLNQAMAPGAPAPQQGLAAAQAPQAEPMIAEGGEAATPEEQALYDDIVGRAYLLIFDEKGGTVRKSVLDSLSGEEPKEALASTAASIFARVLQAAAQGGVEVPGEVKEAAGAEVFETLAEVASKAGVYDFMGDDQAFEAAFLLAADTLRQIETESGTLDPEAAKADFAGMVEADKSGELAAAMQAAGGA